MYFFTDKATPPSDRLHQQLGEEGKVNGPVGAKFAFLSVSVHTDGLPSNLCRPKPTKYIDIEMCNNA